MSYTIGHFPFHVLRSVPDVLQKVRYSPADKCGSELFQRADDSLETAQNRLKVYDEQTAPLIDYYTKKGILFPIDASLPKDQGYAALVGVLNN